MLVVFCEWGFLSEVLSVLLVIVMGSCDLEVGFGVCDVCVGVFGVYEEW